MDRQMVFILLVAHMCPKMPSQVTGSAESLACKTLFFYENLSASQTAMFTFKSLLSGMFDTMSSQICHAVETKWAVCPIFRSEKKTKFISLLINSLPHANGLFPSCTSKWARRYLDRMKRLSE
jgi:hypothetical protein